MAKFAIVTRLYLVGDEGGVGQRHALHKEENVYINLDFVKRVKAVELRFADKNALGTKRTIQATEIEFHGESKGFQGFGVSSSFYAQETPGQVLQGVL